MATLVFVPRNGKQARRLSVHIFNMDGNYSFELETTKPLKHMKATGSGFKSEDDCKRHLRTAARVMITKLERS